MPVPSYDLSTEQLGILAEKTLVNARELLDEAKALGLLEHFPRAFSLAVLAAEEFGKHLMCFGAAGLRPDDQEMWKDFHQRFRSHTPKYENLFAMATAMLPEEESERYAQDIAKHVAADQARKLAGFYVDLIDGEAVHPGEAIGPEEVYGALTVFDQIISAWESRFEEADFIGLFAFAKDEGAEELRYALIENDEKTIERFLGQEMPGD